MQRILFLCADNASLSQMAEGFARLFGDGEHEAYSAGLAPAELVDDRAISLMQEVGCDLSGQRTRSLRELADMAFDVVITLGERRLPEAPAARIAHAHWRCPDPTALDTARYRDIRHDIGHRVRQLFNALPALASEQGSPPVDLGGH